MLNKNKNRYLACAYGGGLIIAFCGVLCDAYWLFWLAFGIIALFCAYDTYRLVVRLAKKSLLLKLVLYVCVPYVSYGIADLLAQEYIVAITHTMPDVYNLATYFLAILFVPYVIICFVMLIPLIFFVIAVVLLFLKIFGLDSIVSRARNCIVAYFGLRNAAHVNYLVFGSVILYFVVTFLFYSIFNVFDKYNSPFIHYTSYYKNNQTCSKVDKEFYIRTLGDNQVSISPFIGKMRTIGVEINKESTHSFLLLFEYGDNGNKKFITTLCN